MRKLILLAIVCCCSLGFVQPAQAQENHAEGPVWVISYYRTKPGKFEEYLKFCAGQAETRWSRRLKIPLSGITWEMIDRVSADSESFLQTRVPGTGKDGGPTCAMVKPFPGWKFVRFSRR